MNSKELILCTGIEMNKNKTLEQKLNHFHVSKDGNDIDSEQSIQVMHKFGLSKYPESYRVNMFRTQNYLRDRKDEDKFNKEGRLTFDTYGRQGIGAVRRKYE